MNRFTIVIAITAIVVFSGCVQSNTQANNTANNSNAPQGNQAGSQGNAVTAKVCPQGLDAWASKIQFGSATTQFSGTDSIFIIVSSDLNCDGRVKASLIGPSGNLVSEQEYNIPQGATGYKDYNPSKNLAAGNYSFEIRYGAELLKTIQITLLAAEPVAPELSEQPNAQKYGEYFSDAYLGKLPLGAQVGPPNNFPQKTTVFDSSTDQLCTSLTIIKTIPAGKTATATYDAANKKYLQEKTVFPMELKTGGTAGCETVPAAGKYERKIYVDDVLAIVLPFEVK